MTGQKLILESQVTRADVMRRAAAIHAYGKGRGRTWSDAMQTAWAEARRNEVSHWKTMSPRHTAWLVEAVRDADMGRAYATRGPAYDAWIEAKERLTTHLQLVVGRDMDGLLETTHDAVMAAIADGSAREMLRAAQIISSDGGKDTDVARAMAALDAARATLLSAGMCA